MGFQGLTLAPLTVYWTMVEVGSLFKGKGSLDTLTFLRENLMKFKTCSALAISLIASASLAAQSSTITGSAGGVAQPASSITMAPSIGTGMRSFATNATTGNKTAATIGAYVTPGFELTSKGENFDLTLSYSLEMSSAQGFGSGQEVKSINKNSYMLNNPVAIATLRFNPEWSFVNTSDIQAMMSNVPGEDYLAVTNLSEVYRKINSNLSVSAGYRFDFLNNTATTVQVADSASPFAAQLNAGQKSGLPAEVLAANENTGNNPHNLRSVALVRAKIKANKDFSTNVSAEAGSITDTSTPVSTKTYSYRVNADTVIQAGSKLNLNIRTRADFMNPEGADAGFSTRLTGRLIAGFKVNDSVTADLINTFRVKNKINFSGTNVYDNETYAGLTYSF